MLKTKKVAQKFGAYRKKLYLGIRFEKAPRGGAVVARWAHNPKAGGSIPSPATMEKQSMIASLFFVRLIDIYYLRAGDILLNCKIWKR